MKKWFWLILLNVHLFAEEIAVNQPHLFNPRTKQIQPLDRPEGWSFDIGGQYTWMSFTTPPTFRGSTGGAEVKVTYDLPNAFFGQVRTVYNIGPLKSSVNSSAESESYTEFVGGYCIGFGPRWTLTPTAGMGMDFLTDKKSSYLIYDPIKLKYTTYYAIIGLAFRYAWDFYTLGAELDCMPIFNQYLKIGGLSGEAWTLKYKTGWTVHLPAGFKLAPKIWMELTPYYRFMPFGASTVLDLSHRTLSEWGAFVSFRFYIQK